MSIYTGYQHFPHRRSLKLKGGLWLSQGARCLYHSPNAAQGRPAQTTRAPWERVYVWEERPLAGALVPIRALR